jgi:hypothetical protein
MYKHRTWNSMGFNNAKKTLLLIDYVTVCMCTLGKCMFRQHMRREQGFGLVHAVCRFGLVGCDPCCSYRLVQDAGIKASSQLALHATLARHCVHLGVRERHEGARGARSNYQRWGSLPLHKVARAVVDQEMGPRASRVPLGALSWVGLVYRNCTRFFFLAPR